jgi:hypothetical protein
MGAILLSLIPFVKICFSVSLWDRIYPMVLGLPFQLFLADLMAAPHATLHVGRIPAGGDPRF